MNSRIIALIIKEILAILKDKKGRMTLIIPPLMQLLIISQAATLEVKNISLAVLNMDTGWYSYELIQRFNGSPYFLNVYHTDSEEKLKSIINDQKAIAGLIIQSDFSKKMATNLSASIQVILDGRRSNAAQIVQGYISRIVQNFETELESENNVAIGEPFPAFRSWFNPNLDYIDYTAPCLIGILSMVLGILVTSLSVAREREMGTFDQLLVSPLNTWEILVGKMVPALIIAVTESTLIMVIAIIVFSLPFHGSLLLFYLSMIVFITAIVGIGLFISSVSYTQQQAILGAFVFMMPTLLLSGFATPIENMPNWLQPFTWFIPIRHFFVIIKGIFLKDISTLEVLSSLWPMAFIAIITLVAAGWMFKRRLN